MGKKYKVIVEKEDKWWVFHIPELNTSGQTNNIAEVENESRGIISAWLEIPFNRVKVEIYELL